MLVLEEAVKGLMRGRSAQPNTKDFLEPWLRDAQLTSVPKAFSRVVTLLNFHTVPWGRSTDPSESRCRRETIASAIVEYSAIVDYRVDMLGSPGSASGWLRHVLENMLVCALDADKGRPMPGLDGSDERTITWPDRVEFDVRDTKDLAFDIVDENERSLRTVSRQNDFKWIEKFGKSLQQCSFAHAITMNEEGTRKNRPMRPEIRGIAEDLLQVSRA